MDEKNNKYKSLNIATLIQAMKFFSIIEKMVSVLFFFFIFNLWVCANLLTIDDSKKMLFIIINWNIIESLGICFECHVSIECVANLCIFHSLSCYCYCISGFFFIHTFVNSVCLVLVYLSAYCIEESFGFDSLFTCFYWILPINIFIVVSHANIIMFSIGHSIIYNLVHYSGIICCSSF